jgi:hypothetical protein
LRIAHGAERLIGVMPMQSFTVVVFVLTFLAASLAPAFGY